MLYLRTRMQLSYHTLLDVVLVLYIGYFVTFHEVAS